MNRDRIPRYFRRGIFSGWILLGVALTGGLAGQTGPRLHIRQSSAATSAGPASAAADTIRVLALRVAFEEDDNASTTGNGQFLPAEAEALNCTDFTVDRPPHDANYFSDQLLAVGNYFRQVSGGLLDLERDSSLVYPPQNEPPIQVGPMASYRPVADHDSSDGLLVSLAETAIRAAFDDVDLGAYQLVVIFHAGLGQDFDYQTLDPTPLDIPSAYIDSAMIIAALGAGGIPLPDGTVYRVPIILAPESQNHIYYDIADDLFFGADDYCDLQTGLTGTLALLIGYALGFPPLFDTSEGATGVGVFGLMDLGSNNGRGLIPAPPTAWTRVQQRWEQPVELSGDEALTARHLESGRIGRITLSRDEYLLVENRVNWIGSERELDLDSLLYRNLYEVDGVDRLPPYFDYLVDSTGIELAASGVITSVPNYDLGLPGSGLLIWHIDETRYTAGLAGINNRREARAVALLEADGAVDLGFPTTALFSNPDQGWRWDLWYAGNEGYFTANPDRLAGNQDRLLSLDSETHPSSRLNSGAGSGIAISRIGPAGNSLSIMVGEDVGGSVVGITRLPEGSRLLGFNGESWIYELGDSLWLGDQRVAILVDSIPPIIISEYDALSSPAEGFWALTLMDPGYLAQRFLPGGDLDTLIQDTVRVATIGVTPSVHPHFDEGKLIIWVEHFPAPSPPDSSRIRYLASPLSFMDPYPYWVSAGDIDGDGNDEQVEIDMQAPTTLTVRNDNGIALDGFPVVGDFRGVVLIANLTGDIRPELLVIESGDIAIYSPEGREQLLLGLQAGPEELFLMHTADGRVGLANGDRIHWFEPEEQNPQWVTPQGRHSRNRVSLNEGQVRMPQPAVLDRARVYNYPNPVTGGRTTIRFYTGSAIRANIRIFTVEGLPVQEVTLTDLSTNDYNEWVWQVGDNPSGLYYAVVEVVGAQTESVLVKIAVVK